MNNDVGERQHESLERWRELLRLDMGEHLKLEKRRRGMPENNLLFVNAANLAGFWWCAQKSPLQAREDELAFFMSYVPKALRLLRPPALKDLTHLSCFGTSRECTKLTTPTRF